MKRKIRGQEGFAFIAVLLALLTVPVLGLAIIGVTSTNYETTKYDSVSQSIFYIAEAGANHVIDLISDEVEQSRGGFETNAELFQSIENRFLGVGFTYDNFESSKAGQPYAVINVSRMTSGEDSRDYKVESTGKIGDRQKTVAAVISISSEIRAINNGVDDDIAFYAKKFVFNGVSINAVTGGIVMDGIETHNLNGNSLLNASNLYFNGPVKMDGGSASFGSSANPGEICVAGDLDLWVGGRNVYGDVRVDGNFRLKDARMHGDVFVNGNVELGWTPQIHKNIYYTGILSAPAYFDTGLLNKCVKVSSVDSFVIPISEYSLRDTNWYINNGYTIKGNTTEAITPNAKWVVDDYYNTNWQNISGYNIIISKGDIVLRGGNGFTGALIAPNGRVEYTGDGEFNGTIISKYETSLSKAGNVFNFKSLWEMFGDDMPVIVHSSSGSGVGGGSSIVFDSTRVVVKSNAKEK